MRRVDRLSIVNPRVRGREQGDKEAVRLRGPLDVSRDHRDIRPGRDERHARLGLAELTTRFLRSPLREQRQHPPFLEGSQGLAVSGVGVLAIAVDRDAVNHLAQRLERPDAGINPRDHETELVPESPPATGSCQCCRCDSRSGWRGQPSARGPFGHKPVDYPTIGGIDAPEQGQHAAELPFLWILGSDRNRQRKLRNLPTSVPNSTVLLSLHDIDIAYRALAETVQFRINVFRPSALFIFATIAVGHAPCQDFLKYSKKSFAISADSTVVLHRRGVSIQYPPVEKEH